MKQTPKTIQSNLRKLRKLIDSTDDPVVRRIAYTIEHALRWATEDTVGWPSMDQEAEDEAFILRKELGMELAENER